MENAKKHGKLDGTIGVYISRIIKGLKANKRPMDRLDLFLVTRCKNEEAFNLALKRLPNLKRTRILLLDPQEEIYSLPQYANLEIYNDLNLEAYEHFKKLWGAVCD